MAQKQDASPGFSLNLLLCLIILPVLSSGNIQENAAEACDYYLYRPMPFADRTMNGCISRKELKAAFGKKVKIGTEDDDGYTFLMAGGEPKRVTNCIDYSDALKSGGSPRSNFGIAMESFFILVCGALSGLENSIPPKHAYIHARDYPAAGKIPVLALHALVGEIEEELEEASSAGSTLLHYAPITGREINPKTKSLKVIWDDLETSFDLVAEGDFNRDGYNDLLVFVSTHSLSGTLRAYEYMLLTRHAGDQKMYDVYSSDKGCLYKNHAYVCSADHKWTPLPKGPANRPEE